jgi:hypothetical protein
MVEIVIIIYTILNISIVIQKAFMLYIFLVDDQWVIPKLK